MDYFKEDIKELSFKNGYIGKGDHNIYDFPLNTVSDCNNVIFKKNCTERRTPYSLFFELTESGYIIINFYIKTFIDPSGNNKEVIIIAAFEPITNSFKIFVKGYYSPSNSYVNYYSTEGFNTDFVNLLEFYTDNFEKGDWTVNGTRYYFRIASDKPSNYFNSFLSLDTFNSRNKFLMIDKCDSEDDFIYCRFPNSDADSEMSGLYRFPVNCFNYNNKVFTEHPQDISVKFSEFTDHVKILVKNSYNNKNLVLWYGFLDKNHAQLTTSLRKFRGFYLDEDIYLVNNRDGYLFIDDTHPSHPSDYTGYITLTDLNLKLGVSYYVEATCAVDPAFKDCVYALVLEFDGMQSIFLRHILCNDHYFLSKLYIQFEDNISRRISAHILFYEEKDTITEKEIADAKQFPLTYKVSGYAGYTSFHNITVHTAGIGKILFLWYMTGETYPQYLKDYSTLITLNSFLGHRYNSSNVKDFDDICNSGSRSLIYNLNTNIKDLLTSIEKDINFYPKLTFVSSAIQDGNIFARSIFNFESIYQIVKDEIVSIQFIYADTYLVITKTDIYHIEFNQLGVINIKGVFDEYPVISYKAITRAYKYNPPEYNTSEHSFGALEFQGLYFATLSNFYVFYKNQPVPLLDGLFKYEYDQISIAHKQNIITGFFNNHNQVFFYFPDISKIFILDIANKNWTIFSFPSLLSSSKFLSYNKDIYFNNNSNIYKYDGITAGNLDPGNNLISFKIETFSSLVSQNFYKAVDSIDLYYELTSSNNEDASVTVTFYKDNSATNYITKVIPLKYNKFKTSIYNSFRDNFSFIRFVITSNSNKIIKFKLNNVFFKYKYTK